MNGLQGIQVLALDVDGVLTDGRVTLTADGTESKSVSFQDIDAVFEARQLGLTIALVSGEQNAWIDVLARRLQITHVLTGAKDKLRALEEIARVCFAPLSSICYVGDSDRDAPAIAAAGFGLAPANATRSAKQAAQRVLKHVGGSGAVGEALMLLKERNDELDEEMGGAVALESPREHDCSSIRRWARESIDVMRRTAEDLAGDIVSAAEMINLSLAEGGKVLIFGNGGSAADAQHFAAELVGRFEMDRGALAAIALTTDTSALTALANDYGEHTMFSRQIEAIGRPGDVAVAISTSGHSPNVLHALACCRERRIKSVALTGRDGGSMPKLADLCLIVPAESTARIQESHGFVIHALCGLIERNAATLA